MPTDFDNEFTADQLEQLHWGMESFPNLINDDDLKLRLKKLLLK